MSLQALHADFPLPHLLLSLTLSSAPLPFFIQLLVLCCCSVAKSCPALCDPMDSSKLGFPAFHYLPEFAQTHVHWVGDAIQPSRPCSYQAHFCLRTWECALSCAWNPHPLRETFNDHLNYISFNCFCVILFYFLPSTWYINTCIYIDIYLSVYHIYLW